MGIESIKLAKCNGDKVDAQLNELITKFGDGGGACGHVPYPAEPPRLAGQAHTHLARRLGHIDRGDSFND
jgi:hypothetical protein